MAATTVGALAIGALVIGDRANGTLRGEHVPTTIAWYLVAFGSLALAVVALERGHRRGEPIPTAWLWAVPIAFRVVLWFTEPTLSDDVYRYLWDGHLLTEGVNPYRYAVDATELDPYSTGLRSQVNNPGLSTPYLPGAQLLFGFVALVLPGGLIDSFGATAMQIAMTAFDLATAGVLVRLLVAVGLPTGRVALYLWNPLVIIETAHGAHLDAYMVFLTVAAIALTLAPSDEARDRRAPASVLAAIATLTRGLSALAVPVLWWRWGWRARALFVVTCGVPLLLFGAGAGFGLEQPPTGTGLFGSARVYAADWQFNNGVFNTILAAFDGPRAGERARGLVGVAMMALGMVVGFRARGDRQPGRDRDRRDIRAITVLFIGYVILTPTLHPWYLIVVLALLPFWTPTDGEGARRWLGVAPWIVLSFLAPLSYLTYRNEQAHAELAWVRQVEWWPTLLLAVAAVALHRSRPLTSRLR